MTNLTLDSITPTDKIRQSFRNLTGRQLLGSILGYDENGNMNSYSQVYDPNNVLADANDAIAKGMSEEAAKKMATKTLSQGRNLEMFANENLDFDKLQAKDWAPLVKEAAVAHPFQTAGLVGLGLGNVGGLVDNNKFGGQLGGLALGGLGASMLARENPYMAAMMTLGGGGLGALFDKLRAKKEQEASQLPQNPNMYRR